MRTYVYYRLRDVFCRRAEQFVDENVSMNAKIYSVKGVYGWINLLFTMLKSTYNNIMKGIA